MLRMFRYFATKRFLLGVGTLLCLGSVFGLNLAFGAQGEFEELGTPVRKAAIMAAVVGPDESGRDDRLYLSCAQTGANLLLLVVDPDNGKTDSYRAPVGPGAWAIERGADNNIYLGTWNGGHLLRFDPKRPELGLRDLGQPIASESYIWMLAAGRDGKLYGCTFPSAKLFSFDPETSRVEDLGRMDETQQYARSLAVAEDGKVYVGIGYGQANVVVFDPKTRTKRAILPAEHQKAVVAAVEKMSDGNVYAQAGAQWFRAQGDELIPVATRQLPGPARFTTRNGKFVKMGRLPLAADALEIVDQRRNDSKKFDLQYHGDGASIFMVARGTKGKIYGSSFIPLQMFQFDPVTGTTSVLGNPTPAEGQLYSLLPYENRLYLAAYSVSAYLSVYDPAKPFQFGTEAEANPRGLGSFGAGHLRPRSMILGPERQIFVGSLPPYGTWGGAMAVVDPQQDKITANYRNIVAQQGIASLAYDAKSGLVFGGSDIAGGGGTKPLAREAHLFAWDHEQKKAVVDIVPVPGDTAIVSLAIARAKVFALSVPSNTLTVYDPAVRRIVHQKRLPFGPPLSVCFGVHTKGRLYGLTGKSIFTVDPQTFQIAEEAKFKGNITAGFALTQDWLYFASGAQLVRYRIPN